MGRKKKKQKVSSNLQPVIGSRDVVSPLLYSSSFLLPVYEENRDYLYHVPFVFWLTEASQAKYVLSLGTECKTIHFAHCQTVNRLRLSSDCSLFGVWPNEQEYITTKSYGLKYYPSISSIKHLGEYSSFVDSVLDESVDMLHLDANILNQEWVNHLLPKLSSNAVLNIFNYEIGEGNECENFIEGLKRSYPYLEFSHGIPLLVVGIGDDLPGALVRLFRVFNHPADGKIMEDIFSRLGVACFDSSTVNIQKETISQLENQLGLLQEKSGEVEQELLLRKSEIDHTLSELKDLEFKSSELTRQYALERGQLSEKISSIRNNNISTSHQLDTLKESFDEKMIEIAKKTVLLSQTLDELKAVKEHARSSSNNYNLIRTEAEKLRLDLAVQLAEKQHKEIEIANKGSEITGYIKTIDVDRVELKKYEIQCTELSRKLTKSNIQHQEKIALVAKLQQALAEQQQQVSDVKQVIADKNSEIANYIKITGVERAELGRYEKQCAELSSKLNNTDIQYQEKKTLIAKLQQALAEQHQEVSNIKQIVADKDSEIASYMKITEEDSITLGNYEKRCAALECRVNEIHAQQKEDLSLIHELKVELREQVQEVANSKQVIAGYAELLKASGEDNLELRQSLAVLNESYEASLTKVELLTEGANLKVGELAFLTRSINELEDSYLNEVEKNKKLIGEPDLTLQTLQCQIDDAKLDDRSTNGEQELLRENLKLKEEAEDAMLSMQKMKEGMDSIKREEELKFSNLTTEKNELEHKLALRFQELALLTKELGSKDAETLIRNEYINNFHKVHTGVIRRIRYRAFVFYRQKKIIDKSQLFDSTWYQAQYSIPKQLDPIEHYLKEGVFRGFNPSKSFDSTAYLTMYSDVKDSGINPLIHYIQHGRKENRLTQKY